MPRGRKGRSLKKGGSGGVSAAERQCRRHFLTPGGMRRALHPLTRMHPASRRGRPGGRERLAPPRTGEMPSVLGNTTGPAAPCLSWRLINEEDDTCPRPPCAVQGKGRLRRWQREAEPRGLLPLTPSPSAAGRTPGQSGARLWLTGTQRHGRFSWKREHGSGERGLKGWERLCRTRVSKIPPRIGTAGFIFHFQPCFQTGGRASSSEEAA